MAHISVGSGLSIAQANATYCTIVNHGSTAATARPSGAAQVVWIGTVTPTNAVLDDEWLDKSVSPAVLRRHNGTGFDTLGGGLAVSGTPTDDQAVVWSAAQSAWVPATQSGIIDAGAATNATGTATALAATVDVPNTSFAFAPNGSRELWVSGSCTLQFSSTPTTGSFAGINVLEVSNGVDPVLSFGGVVAASPASTAVTVVVPPTRVGVLARTRTFKIQASRSGSSVAGNVLNTVNYPTILRGEWR